MKAEVVKLVAVSIAFVSCGAEPAKKNDINQQSSNDEIKLGEVGKAPEDDRVVLTEVSTTS